MQGRPQDYMDVGIVHFMAFPEVMKGEGPVVETLRAICDDDYFGAVEVTRIRDAAARRTAIEMVRKAGMKLGFGAQPALLGGKCDLNSIEAPVRQKALDVARACLAEAQEWQADGMAVLSGRDPGEDGRKLAKTMLIASLKEICEYSRRDAEMPILLESFDRVPFGKNCFVGPTEEAALIADKVYPYFLFFGLMLDLSHLPLLAEAGADAVKAAAPYLRHVHVGNCVKADPNHPAYGDEHPVMGTPGGEVGVDELAGFLQALLDAGYLSEGGHKVVAFEVKPFGDQTSEEVIAQSKAVLDAAWAAL